MTAEKQPFVVSPIFEWLWNCNKPIVIQQGGTSSGKTYSILQYLYCIAASNPKTTITVAGQDMPNLKVGAIRDFNNILNSCDFFKRFILSINKTDQVYTFTNGSLIEFKAYDDEQDAKNGKRNILFVNEANGISWAIFEQLQIRTTDKVILDYNPSAPFWAHEKLIGREDVQLFISNYTHNPFLSPEIKRKIELLKQTDPERWKVYGLGKTGKVEGVVFANVNWISEFPKHITKYCLGLDFGFTNDPTTLIKCGESDGELYAERIIYRTGMTNADINNEFKRLGITKNDIIYADSADPKTILELQLMGWRVRSAKKGADSIRFGIQTIKNYSKLNIVNCEFWKKEQISYIWAVDRLTSKFDNVPVDAYNHLWDALRYGVQGLRNGGSLAKTKIKN